jgi:hypothetical protein
MAPEGGEVIYLKAETAKSAKIYAKFAKLMLLADFAGCFFASFAVKCI